MLHLNDLKISIRT